MKEKVVEILVYLMAAMQEHRQINELDLDDLRSRGYTQSEISAAFSWLYDQPPSVAKGTKVGESGDGVSRRVFHDAEKAILTAEGQGYLIQLSELGLLDRHDMEVVIERAMMAGYDQLTVAELREIVAAVLLSKDGGNDRAGRTLLNSGDTIH